jgi:sugar phosphate isomerase/epimerase
VTAGRVEDALERLGRHGFNTVDIGILPRFCPHYDPLTATEDIRRGVADCVAMNGLAATTLNTGPGAFNAPGADVATIYKAASENFALAQALGCKVVTIQNGVAAPRAEWMEGARKVAYHLRELARTAQGMGLALSVEAPHRGTLASDARQAADLLDLIGGGMTCTFDTSHIQAGGQTIRQGLALLGDRIDHVHLRDARGEDTHVAPGDGDVPFEHLFSWLEERRYAGGVTLEVLPPGDRPLEEVDAQIERGRDYIRRALSARVSGK